MLLESCVPAACDGIVADLMTHAGRMRGAGAILFLAVLAACSGEESRADADWQPSLQADKWDIRYSPGMAEHPRQEETGWRFSFPRYDGALPCEDHLGPACPSVHYVTTRAGGPLRGQSITMTIEISGAATFRYRLERSNTCNTPATVRLLIQRRNDDLTKEFYRWWSNPKALALRPGEQTVTVPKTPDQWSSVFGKKGEVAREDFSLALEDAENIGMTFGGGCFFGHGVNVTGGQATFAVTEFSISREDGN